MGSGKILPYIKSQLPECQYPDFVFERYHLSLGKISSPAWLSNFPGEYLRFKDAHTGQIWMTDEYCDWVTGVRPVLKAVEEFSGKVLISGLGIGMLLECLAAQGISKEVTVLEKSSDVIDAVFSKLRLKDMRVKVVQCDANDFTDYGSHEIVWHDIWIDSAPSLESSKILVDKYQAAWKWSWSQEMQKLGCLS